MSKPILIIGATSSIARGAAFAFAEKGHSLYLAARDETELERIAADINIRYDVPVDWGSFDAHTFDQHAPFLAKATQMLGGLEGVLYAAGDLGDQRAAEHDFSMAHAIIDCNYTGAASLLGHCANYLEKQRHGFIIGVSSVAGDRGRQSNYIYGSSKGAFSLFLQGLRNRLFSANVRVITIKPGFVDTAMTFGREGLFLVAPPMEIGAKIVKSLEKNRNVVYLPWFWRWIMLITKMIPEMIFKRLKL